VLNEVLSTKNGKRKYKKMTDEEKRKRLDESKVNRSNLITGFNLLMKCVPGTYKLNRPEILMSAVNYIRKLEICIENKVNISTANYIRELEESNEKKANYIRELEECIEKRINYSMPLPMESTQLFSTPTDCDPVPSTCMEQDSDSTLDCYIVPSSPMAEGLSSPMDTAPSSPMATGPSSPMVTGLTTELVTGLSSLMAEYSDISVPNSPMVTGPTTQLVTGPSSPMAEYSDILEPSSLMAEGPSTTMDEHLIETVPVELTSSDEIAQWVGVNLNSEEEEEEELPEFNSVEELS
jgi:hypothetical protein